jgi:hypothetical protein
MSAWSLQPLLVILAILQSLLASLGKDAYKGAIADTVLHIGD